MTQSAFYKTNISVIPAESLSGNPCALCSKYYLFYFFGKKVVQGLANSIGVVVSKKYLRDLVVTFQNNFISLTPQRTKIFPPSYNLEVIY